MAERQAGEDMSERKRLLNDLLHQNKFKIPRTLNYIFGMWPLFITTHH